MKCEGKTQKDRVHDMADTLTIDKEKVRQEMIEKNLLSLQTELTRQRRWRMRVMILLMTSLLLTIVFGTLESPFIYTFSNIGNFFSYRWLFIVWAILAGIAIQTAILALFRLEEYAREKKAKIVFLALSVVFLVATAVIPALRDIYPLWHVFHYVTAVFYALFIFLALFPFALWVSRENPRLRKVILAWLGVIWGGSLLALVLFGKSGLFEMWFFVGVMLFLLYLSLMLFEEKIVKMSVRFLRDEPNLNLAIEKIFINLDEPRSREKNRQVTPEEDADVS